MNIRPTFVNNL